jgi:hypothetical protein
VDDVTRDAASRVNVVVVVLLFVLRVSTLPAAS